MKCQGETARRLLGYAFSLILHLTVALPGALGLLRPSETAAPPAQAPPELTIALLPAREAEPPPPALTPPRPAPPKHTPPASPARAVPRHLAPPSPAQPPEPAPLAVPLPEGTAAPLEGAPTGTPDGAGDGQAPPAGPSHALLAQLARRLAQAANAGDPAWATLALGPVGELRCFISLEAGHVSASRVSVVGGSSARASAIFHRAIGGLSGSNYALLNGQATGGESYRVELTLVSSQLSLNKARHGWSVSPGLRSATGYFILPAGRRFDATVSVL